MITFIHSAQHTVLFAIEGALTNLIEAPAVTVITQKYSTTATTMTFE